MKYQKTIYIAAACAIVAIVAAVLYHFLMPKPLGFNVVTDYSKTLTAPMTSAQTFVPVTSLTLKDGTPLTMSLLGNIVFLTIEPGLANEEIVACTGIDSTLKRFTGCTRGLSFSGTSLAPVPANQKSHSSGTSVVMSNVHYVYQQFLDKDNGTQYVTSTVVLQSATGTELFAFPYVTSASAYPVLNGQLATKGYVDSVGSAGWSPSTTLGMAKDSNGNAYINASTTASDNGGFLLFSSSTSVLGKIFWDIRSFLARATTWTGNQVFNGTATFNQAVTFTNSILCSAGFCVLFVPTPTDPGMAANKVYVDTNVSYGTATGTAGAVIVAGNALYISTTGTLFLTDADATSTAYNFVGIAVEAATSTNSVRYAKYGGVADLFSGLTPGTTYYLSGTPGAVSAVAGTIPVKVGVALSAARMQIHTPDSEADSTGSQSLTFNGSATAITTSYIPTHITLYCNSGNSHGEWIRTSAGGAAQYSVGWNNTAAGVPIGSATQACSWIEGGPNTFTVVVATTTSGFTMTPSNVGGTPARTILWIAEYDKD